MYSAIRVNGSFNCMVAHSVSATDTLSIASKQLSKLTSRSGPGKKGVRFELVRGDELTRASGRWATKWRLVDKDNDRYQERVIEQGSGKVLHEIDEPLSAHRGHGSARNKSRRS
jgi:hypothetical protein